MTLVVLGRRPWDEREKLLFYTLTYCPPTHTYTTHLLQRAKPDFMVIAPADPAESSESMQPAYGRGADLDDGDSSHAGKSKNHQRHLPLSALDNPIS